MRFVAALPDRGRHAAPIRRRSGATASSGGSATRPGTRPSSPWAAGLGPIPPGPGNPLGTRWIGTSAPGIGIHGTHAPSTVGTAASHGCIRMYMSDVEWLFERVRVGTPVFFVALGRG